MPYVCTVFQLELVPPCPTISNIGIRGDTSFEPIPGLFYFSLGPKQSGDGAYD